MESCQVALTLWKERRGVLGVVGKFGKELRDHELVHWELRGHIHSFSKWFLSTHLVKALCCACVCWVCCYCDVLKLVFKNYPFQIIIFLQFTKRVGEAG